MTAVLTIAGVTPWVTNFWDGKDGSLLKAQAAAKAMRIEHRLTDQKGKILLTVNKDGDICEEAAPPFKVQVIERLSDDVISGNPKRRQLAIGVARLLLGVNLS